MKKILVLILCACLLLPVLTGCGEIKTPYVPTGDGLYNEGSTQPSVSRPSTSEQSLTLVYYPEKTLNPYQTADHTNRVLFPLLYQGLFTVDEKYQAWPILCSGFTRSADMKTYTFYLENATFSDGSAITAQDVTASLNAAQQSSVYSGRFRYISGISAGEDGSVVIQLSTPYADLPILLDIPIVKEADVHAEQPLGTGPYYLQARKNGLQLTRRKDWWCHASLSVTASYIPLVEGQSNAQIRDEYDFGNVDLVCTDPGSDLYVDFHSDYELWSCENGIFLYLACNEKSAVFSNQTLRQALTHAIDRDLLVETYYRGFAEAATLPASPRSPYYNRLLATKFTYRPDAFPTAVEDAKLVGQKITLLVNKADSRRVRVAHAIADMLSQGGLVVTVSALSGTSYTNALTKGSYDLHLGQTILSPNMDLSAFYASKGSLNYGGLSDTIIASMCQEALANEGNYYTLHKLVMEDATLCPLLFRSYAIYTSRGVFEQLDAVRDNLFFYTLGKTAEDVYLP